MTGDKITVLTAAGERLTVPLAKVEFDSKEGKHVELVGVLDKLPVDCLLGRSSFGKTLSRQSILDQWEENALAADAGGQEAFVVTRRQRALEEALLRADELIDRESSIAVKSLYKKKRETKREGPEEGELQTLFEGQIPEEKGKENSENGTVVTDVTLEKIRREAFQKAPQESGSYFFTNDLLFHRKHLSDEHNGTRYVDRIVVPESYRNKILRVGHTIPLSGHMGSKKTFDRIAAHFSWPGLSLGVSKYCATCPQCQLVARKLKSKRAPLKPVEIVTEPFKKIAIDIVGELPRTTTGYKYILTIVDYARRYPESIPLRTTNAKTVAEALI